MADLITVTDGSSFLTERTYGPLVAPNQGHALMTSFVLRQHDYRPVAACPAEAGLEDCRSPICYPQRVRNVCRSIDQRYGLPGSPSPRLFCRL
uniref:hypothetical protein n=1 Tax=Streptomyces asoensis TaxID=249586 RepID=UPI00209BC89F|nr:hypothetical protein [Streptomyces asoensis]